MELRQANKNSRTLHRVEAAASREQEVTQPMFRMEGHHVVFVGHYTKRPASVVGPLFYSSQGSSTGSRFFGQPSFAEVERPHTTSAIDLRPHATSYSHWRNTDRRQPRKKSVTDVMQRVQAPACSSPNAGTKAYYEHANYTGAFGLALQEERRPAAYQTHRMGNAYMEPAHKGLPPAPPSCDYIRFHEPNSGF
eukprot:TRINITY_DN52202_c0_g1_i1.p1 TRINITY_DN52202_c0_g1~~TRINITY_DN52202_c0_g1_i1.p1  ORF type:complete len:193 (-),score=22.37 TRINITY_DN52202_c0_g1_i1:15-593(-)